MSSTLYNCSKCHINYNESEVNKIKAGHVTAYSCKKCNSPCFPAESEPSGENTAVDGPILHSRPFPVWGKWLIGIILVSPMLITAYIQYDLHMDSEKKIDKLKNHFKNIEEREQKGENVDMFDRLDPFLKGNTGEK